LQRGLQVYKEVCAACHSLKYVSFYQLADLGYSEAEVKAIANQWAIEVPSVNPDTGEAATRKALVSDRFPSPYANETAARAANNNAYPPDLSLIAEPARRRQLRLLAADRLCRCEHLSQRGRPPVPNDAKPGPGLHFNPYFANLNIAMPARSCPTGR
jgi:ubiquinol-cytochrome c reductase cytochrome c1 subunit